MAVVIINSMTNRINDQSHGHEHDLEAIGICGDERACNGHGGMVKAHGGVVIAATAVEVAAITVIDSSGRVAVAIQWMVNVAVVVANESTSGLFNGSASGSRNGTSARDGGSVEHMWM